MRVAVSKEDRDAIAQLYEKALQDYPETETWLNYIDFMKGRMEEVRSWWLVFYRDSHS